MDGKFPAGYKGVIPDSAAIEVLLKKQNIRVSASKGFHILANEKFKGVRVEATNTKHCFVFRKPRTRRGKRNT